MPLSVFSRLFGRKATEAPRSTDGRLVYAVGDIHGRLDLLDLLLASIAEDVAQTAEGQRPLLVFLGDYVDRGAESMGVIDRILGLRAKGEFEVVALKGNHEEALLEFLDQPTFGPTWLDHGGGPTLVSYGVAPPATRTDPAAWAEASAAFAAVLPRAHTTFLKTLELIVELGSYAFVHAGVRPGVALDAQAEKDLLWIRGEFLDARAGFGKIIVHGHTPMAEAQATPNRIGVDTGAYATGVLTAVRLQGEDCRFLQAKLSRAGTLSQA